MAASALISALRLDDNRLNLGDFDSSGLNCDNWNWDSNQDSSLGCFPLMMCKRKKADISAFFNDVYSLNFLSILLSFFRYLPGKLK
jgi:hypothetical protein